MKPFSLYIHIPFCLHKCPYCDFNTYAVYAVPEDQYVAALLAELSYRASLPEWQGRPIQTIFFGGGTPSLFSATAIAKILEAARQHFEILPNPEISLEANPGSLSLEALSGYHSAGVNRISIGAQSFHPQLLSTLGRIHSPDQIFAAFELSRQAGIENINVDLMYGIPGQSVDDFNTDLQTAFSLNTNHISAYNLTIENGTPFYSAWKRGALVCPPETRVVEMMELVANKLPSHGLQRYEISNYAKSGLEARHNVAYWNGDDYIGLGAGAHSFVRSSRKDSEVQGVRWSNYATVTQYNNAAVTSGNAESWREELSKDSAIFEYFFLGLRKIDGVSLAQFETLFDTTFDLAYPRLAVFLRSEELATISRETIVLTPKGQLLNDSVLEHFAKPMVENSAI